MIVIIIEIPGGAARRRSTRLEFLLPTLLYREAQYVCHATNSLSKASHWAPRRILNSCASCSFIGDPVIITRQRHLAHVPVKGVHALGTVIWSKGLAADNERITLHSSSVTKLVPPDFEDYFSPFSGPDLSLQSYV